MDFNDINRKQHFTWIFDDINKNNTLHEFLMISTKTTFYMNF